VQVVLYSHIRGCMSSAESFIDTIKLNVVRQKVWLKSNSQSFYAKLDCIWNANTRICSVGAIHITSSIVV